MNYGYIAIHSPDRFQSSKAAVILKDRYRQNYLCSFLALLSPLKSFPWQIFQSSCFILVSTLALLSLFCFLKLLLLLPELSVLMFLFIPTCPLSSSSVLPETTANKKSWGGQDEWFHLQLILHLMLFGTWNLSIGLGVDLRNSNFYLEKRKQLYSTHGFWENIIGAYPES